MSKESNEALESLLYFLARTSIAHHLAKDTRSLANSAGFVIIGQ
jgi:hypothetical protein